MNTAQINRSNRKELKSIRGRYYMAPMLRLYEDKITSQGLPDATNYLSAVMRAAQPEVEMILEARKKAGKIKSIDQTRKTVAGNAFQALVFCALASLQAGGHIPAHLIFTLKTKNNSRLGGSVIQVGPETIRPDVDLLVYSEREHMPENMPVYIYSLKTSLRERGGQTHRWKVLLDIVTAENCRSIKEKYDLQYAGQADFRMGLITTNFYDEITSPQQRGLFRFFDHVYLTKPGNFTSPVARFSRITDDLTEIYG